MHTATQLDRSQFSIRVGERPAGPQDLFPGWHGHDRLGVVVHEPFGALGASHLLQVAITAFYDVRPSRRAGKPSPGDPLAIYPEVYLFHVGGVYGDHRWLDVFPPRKEVVLENDAPLVLEAINDRAITRLAVPDVTPVPCEHAWKEPSTARDRIVSTFAYTASGRTREADVEIRGVEDVTQFNVRKVLGSTAHYSETIGPAGRPENDAESRALAVERRERLRDDGAVVESYRRIDLTDALEMLVPGPASGTGKRNRPSRTGPV